MIYSSSGAEGMVSAPCLQHRGPARVPSAPASCCRSRCDSCRSRPEPVMEHQDPLSVSADLLIVLIVTDLDGSADGSFLVRASSSDREAYLLKNPLSMACGSLLAGADPFPPALTGAAPAAPGEEGAYSAPSSVSTFPLRRLPLDALVADRLPCWDRLPLCGPFIISNSRSVSS